MDLHDPFRFRPTIVIGTGLDLADASARHPVFLAQPSQDQLTLLTFDF